MPTDELPLDIPYEKLADWLTSRQKLSKDWHKKLQAIRAKAGEAAKDLPTELSVPQGEPPGYTTVKSIRDTLAKTADKTFFGSLTGTAGLWDKILRAYEKDNVFLGEVGQILVRNVDFEIPFLKQQAAKEQQQLAALERKHTEHLHSAVQAARQYQQECQNIGIRGASIVQELRALTKELPATFQKAAQQLQSSSISEACSHYATFVATTLGSDSSKARSAAELLPAIHHVRDAELGAGREAVQQEASAASEQTLEEHAHTLGTEMADSASSTAQPAGNSAPAGQEGHANGGADEEISWDIDLSAAEGDDPAEGTSEDIDWDAGPASDSNADVQKAEWSIEVDTDDTKPASAPATEQGGIVRRMVGDADFRSSLVNEVHELMAFLQMRLSEGGSAQILGASHDLLDPVSSAALKHWLQELRDAAGHMTSERTQQLMLFQTSERYLARAAAALQHKAGQEAKFRRQAQQVEARRQSIRSTLSAGAAKLATLLEQTRAAKQLAEEALTTQLDRRVLIVGEINTFLD